MRHQLGRQAERVRRRRGQRGFSLIELTIAMFVLTFGMLGGMLIITVAVASNAQSRYDTAAVALAQSTMDRIIVISNTAATSAQTTQMTDCNNATTTVNASIGGAQLITLADSTQLIDFTQAKASVPAGYQMDYTLCAAGPSSYSAGLAQQYDVRWNIQAGPTNSTQLVLVAAKAKYQATTGQTQARFFALPVTLRAFRGN